MAVEIRGGFLLRRCAARLRPNLLISVGQSTTAKTAVLAAGTLSLQIRVVIAQEGHLTRHNFTQQHPKGIHINFPIERLPQQQSGAIYAGRPGPDIRTPY